MQTEARNHPGLARRTGRSGCRCAGGAVLAAPPWPRLARGPRRPSRRTRTRPGVLDDLLADLPEVRLDDRGHRGGGRGEQSGFDGDDHLAPPNRRPFLYRILYKPDDPDLYK